MENKGVPATSATHHCLTVPSSISWEDEAKYVVLTEHNQGDPSQRWQIITRKSPYYIQRLASVQYPKGRTNTRGEDPHIYWVLENKVETLTHQDNWNLDWNDIRRFLPNFINKVPAIGYGKYPIKGAEPLCYD